MGRSVAGKETFERTKNNAKRVNLSGRMCFRRSMDSTLEFSKRHHLQASFTTSTSHLKKMKTRKPRKEMKRKK